MADFIWTENESYPVPEHFQRIYGENVIDITDKLQLYAHKNTYSFLKKGTDFVLVLGYWFLPDDPDGYCATRLLDDFEERSISDIKRSMAGQYTVIIMKGHLIYFFSDLGQVRNIFYSSDRCIISSSFSATEDIAGNCENRLNINQMLQYLAMKHVLYPCWIGGETIHLGINRLRPYEYIVLDTASLELRIGRLEFRLDNRKEPDISLLASILLNNLRNTIQNPVFLGKRVGITLTGGYDTRLIAGIAANYYSSSSFRLATSRNAHGSLRDSKIARAIANMLNFPIDIHSTMKSDMRLPFSVLTEGCAPAENAFITPIIENAGSYDLGFGGCFGTELFMPLPKCKSILDYVDQSVTKAKQFLQTEEKRWEQFRLSLLQEFENIARHYELSVTDINDLIRIFYFHVACSFSSFMLAAYNVKGLQIEPYGHFAILETALKVPKYMYASRMFRGRFLIQKVAMERISRRMGSTFTSHAHAMLPFTIRNLPFHIASGLYYLSAEIPRQIRGKIRSYIEISISDVCYRSYGWEALFFHRLREKYGSAVGIA